MNVFTCKQNTAVGSQAWKEPWMRHYTASNPINCTKPLINDKHEILIKIYPTWLCISVSSRYKWWGVWYISSQILLLRDIDGHIINQHIIYDQKRCKRTIFTKSIKNHICHLSKRPETTVDKYLPLKYFLDMIIHHHQIFDWKRPTVATFGQFLLQINMTWRPGTIDMACTREDCTNKCTRHFHIPWNIWISFQKSKTMIRRKLDVSLISKIKCQSNKPKCLTLWLMTNMFHIIIYFTFWSCIKNPVKYLKLIFFFYQNSQPLTVFSKNSILDVL